MCSRKEQCIRPRCGRASHGQERAGHLRKLAMASKRMSRGKAQAWSALKALSFSFRFSGNLMAQVITFASIPILTRYYDPQSYAALGIFVSVVSTLAPSSTGKFDVASVVVRTRALSGALLGAAIWCALIFSGLLLLVAVGVAHFGGAAVIDELGTLEIYLLAVGVLLAALNTTLKNMATYVEVYYAISISVLIQAVLTLVIAVGAHYWWTPVNGLVLGFLAGSLMSFLTLVYLLSKHMSMVVLFDFKAIFGAMRSYVTFPLYNASTSVFDGLFVWLPVYFLTVFFGAAEVGLFFLVNRLLVGPLSLVTNSLSPLILKNSAAAISKRVMPNRSFSDPFLRLSACSVLFCLGFAGGTRCSSTTGLKRVGERCHLHLSSSSHGDFPFCRFHFFTYIFEHWAKRPCRDLEDKWFLHFILSLQLLRWLRQSEKFLIVICLTEIVLYAVQLALIIQSACQPAKVK